MTRKEVVDYWVKTSDKDFKVMKSLVGDKHYTWALFVGHLVIEKLLKAYYVKTVGVNVPLIHNLLRIADKADLKLTEEQKNFLNVLTTFNIKGRYSDYKYKFYKSCTRRFTENNIDKIKEFRSWLKKQIKE